MEFWTMLAELQWLLSTPLLRQHRSCCPSFGITLLLSFYNASSHANHAHFCGAVSCLGACLEMGTIEALTTCKQHICRERHQATLLRRSIKPASSVVCNHLLVFVPSNSFAKACSNQGTYFTWVIVSVVGMKLVPNRRFAGRDAPHQIPICLLLLEGCLPKLLHSSKHLMQHLGHKSCTKRSFHEMSSHINQSAIPNMAAAALVSPSQGSKL